MADRAFTALDPQLVAGVVLSGGKSSRMGQDKALLTWQGKSLLERAVARLQPVCKEVMILSDYPQHEVKGAIRHPDRYPDAGPLGGLITAFHQTSCPYILVTAVDLPMLSPAFLQWVLRPLAEGEKGRIPQEQAQLHPLCALYHRDLLPDWEYALSVHRLGLIQVLSGLPVAVETVDAACDFYFPELFFNLNRPRDWETFQTRLL